MENLKPSCAFSGLWTHLAYILYASFRMILNAPKKLLSFLRRQKFANFYDERTDRNIGFLTKEEQLALKGAVVAIAGCGGMGGLLASVLLRLGVGEIRIADTERFDVSNINRQFGATRKTVGKSKAWATYRALRRIAKDTKIVVYPDGVIEKTVESFVDGCDFVFDEVEFWATGARILLHQTCRRKNITILNCNVVGFGSYFFKFSPECKPLEEIWELTYDEAVHLQKKVQERTANKEEMELIMRLIFKGLVPFGIPEYSADLKEYSSKMAVELRLLQEGRASICSTTPPFSTGFMAIRFLAEFLDKKSKTKRAIAVCPPIPGFIHLDAWKMEATIVQPEDAEKMFKNAA